MVDFGVESFGNYFFDPASRPILCWLFLLIDSALPLLIRLYLVESSYPKFPSINPSLFPASEKNECTSEKGMRYKIEE